MRDCDYCHGEPHACPPAYYYTLAAEIGGYDCGGWVACRKHRADAERAVEFAFLTWTTSSRNATNPPRLTMYRVVPRPSGVRRPERIAVIRPKPAVAAAFYTLNKTEI